MLQNRAGHDARCSDVCKVYIPKGWNSGKGDSAGFESQGKVMDDLLGNKKLPGNLDGAII
jgi:hypothetical protein